MICNQLSTIANSISRGFHPRGLQNGSYIVEPKTRPGCQLGLGSLDLLHSGKDASITHMLHGGNGFPESHYTTDFARTIFDMGATEERRDMRSLRVWSTDLQQAKRDKANGRTM